MLKIVYNNNIYWQLNRVGLTLYNKIQLTHLYVVLAINYAYYRSLLLKYSTFTVFVSSVKTLIVLVSSIIISISYSGFRKIIDIFIVNINVSDPKIDPWGRLFL